MAKPSDRPPLDLAALRTRLGSPFASLETLPSLADTVYYVRLALVVEAMIRNGGNITHAAAALHTNRRVIREILKLASLHPWPKRPLDLAQAFVAVLFGLGREPTPAPEQEP